MAIPAGIIFLWSGAIVDIPPGYILCDGGGGSPDLRDRFVVGAGGTYDPDDIGGAVNHNHVFTGDGHFHTLAGGSFLQTGSGRHDVTSVDPAVGLTDNADGRPPYYALAYIMKT